MYSLSENQLTGPQGLLQKPRGKCQSWGVGSWKPRVGLSDSAATMVISGRLDTDRSLSEVLSLASVQRFMKMTISQESDIKPASHRK